VSYGSDYALAGGLTVSLYANNGAGGVPGELLYSSAPIDINSGGGVVSINYANELIPNELTFLVEFSGQDATHKAGLLFPNSDPSVGSLAFNDYWVKDAGGAFSLQHAVVPEPSTYALAGAAGLAWLGFAGYRRFRK
ncbi:MAG TPA: PEP-CTERM sorting domain-containing protein, partial [Candidatus Limnocylindria bacterium]|nr:PEP-CTERM sorting domain-containing protein [Candidatus Limnocylindria bacterium]